ncbi:MAG: 2-amino-4-hydroxy-6-hydroxymethyldihydropteridine diphosphokinase [Rhodothermia bacterium]
MIGANPVQGTQVHDAYLSLGSNQGDRLDFLNRASGRLRTLEGVVVMSASPVYESKAHLSPGQDAAPDFLNAVIHVRTTLDPIDLLAKCIDVEHHLGRIRGPERWLPRTLDIDILLIDGVSRSDDRLTLPHPRMHERRFVLQPLCDIDPDLHVPAPLDASARDLLANCRDVAPISRYADIGVQ